MDDLSPMGFEISLGDTMEWIAGRMKAGTGIIDAKRRRAIESRMGFAKGSQRGKEGEITWQAGSHRMTVIYNQLVSVMGLDFLVIWPGNGPKMTVWSTSK